MSFRQLMLFLLLKHSFLSVVLKAHTKSAKDKKLMAMNRKSTFLDEIGADNLIKAANYHTHTLLHLFHIGC